MPQLSSGEYSLVYNAFSFTFAAMFAAFIYFVLSRGQVALKYRAALTLSALVVAVAGYHYLRIFESWQAAFTLDAATGAYVPSGAPFNDAYRYIDWLLTVPLLVAELVAVIGLSRAQTTSLTWRLGLAAALMVILGYPGEIAGDLGARFVWGSLSTIPFLYILYTLFVRMGPAINNQEGEARMLLRNIRYVLLATWGFYPIVFMLPYFGGLSAGAVVAIQVGYCIADVLAKAGYGVLIYRIARAKTEAEGLVPELAKVPAAG